MKMGRYSMQLQMRNVDQALVLKPVGRLAADTHEHLKVAWLNNVDWQYLIVDLSETQFIDSIGLATLVSGLKTARQRDGDLLLVNPANSIRIILDLTAMNRVFPTVSTVEEALEWIASQ
jgi:anti-sigma B factor antagonist